MCSTSQCRPIPSEEEGRRTAPVATPAGTANRESGGEPDVWWGEDGIDALIWADPTPYERPQSPAVCEPTPVSKGAADV